MTHAGANYVLRLYVAGMTLRSVRAIANIREICADHLAGRCDLQVIDVYQQARLAAGEEIIVLPTLVKLGPGPFRRIIGDLSDRRSVLLELGLLTGAMMGAGGDDGRDTRNGSSG